MSDVKKLLVDWMVSLDLSTAMTVASEVVSHSQSDDPIPIRTVKLKTTYVL